MKLRLIHILTALTLSAPAWAQSLTAHRGDVPGSYNYWLYNPDNDLDSEEEPKPVVVFLHGASLCGNDLNRVKRYGTIDAIEKGHNIDAYVIAPQNPGGAWKPEKVMKIIDAVGENHNIDYDRIYVIGMSLGGYGAIDMAATYPDEIAAAMAFCGGGSVRDLSGLKDVPLWIIHGTGDRAVSVSQSDRVVEAVKATGETTRLNYDRIPGMNHSAPARFFYLRESYDWLFNHSLKDEDRPAAETFDITGSLKKSAYTNSSRKKSSKKKSGTKRRTSSRKKKRK